MPSRSVSLVRYAVSLAFLGVMLCAGTTAEAQQRPFTLERATVGAGVRYGSENLNLGLGARGGYTLRQGIYIGGLFDYWFGESEETSGFGARATAKSRGWNLLGVGGYDFGVAHNIVIRPYAGFGIFNASVEGCVDVLGNERCVDDSETDAAGVLGGEAMFDFDGIHVGGDLRILIADETAVILGANVGMDF